MSWLSIATLVIVIFTSPQLMLNAQEDSKGGLGGIQGIVLDPDGRPTPEARVTAEPEETAPSGKVYSSVSDEKGGFLIEHLKPGVYVVPAAKEQDGYPNPDFAAFAIDSSALPRVSVLAGLITRGVVVRLEPKGATLVGTIRDAISHKPLVTARITLTRLDHKDLFVSTGPDTNGDFKIVLPSRPFEVEIVAPGYLAWRPTGIVLLEPEVTKTLDVLMKKVSQ